MIRVEQAAYRVGSKMLLQGIDAEVRPGEFLSILGANGAGKSTLLKLMSGDLPTSEGQIWLRDKRIENFASSSMARFRAVLSQQHSLALAFTVQELVLMGRYPHFRGRPGDDDYLVVTKALSEVGMLNYRERSYHTLSGGEQQRAQLARVLAQIYDQPEGILFLDEPTNGLDILHQQQILKTARNLADRGYCVVAILHDINYAIHFSDRVLLLHQGKSLGFGPPKSVIDEQSIEQAYGIKVRFVHDNNLLNPLVVPRLD